MTANVEAHWPGAAASDVQIGAELNRLLPVQCSGKLAHSCRHQWLTQISVVGSVCYSLNKLGLDFDLA